MLIDSERPKEMAEDMLRKIEKEKHNALNDAGDYKRLDAQADIVQKMLDLIENMEKEKAREAKRQAWEDELALAVGREFLKMYRAEFLRKMRQTVKAGFVQKHVGEELKNENQHPDP